MRNNDLGKTTAQRKWTRQAVFCYCIGAECNKCDIPEDFKPKCCMKATLLELNEIIGKPPKKMIEELREELEIKGVFIDRYIIED